MRKSIFALLAAVGLAGCGAGGLQPESVSEKKMSELSEEQVKGLCVHNVEVFRDRLPRESWGTQHCAMVTVVLAMAKAKELNAPLAEQCSAEIAICHDATGTAEQDMEPAQACNHVDLEKARSCDAPVSMLQACLAERNEEIARVAADVKFNRICSAEIPLKQASSMEGPACQKLLSVCKESGLALPKHLF